MVDEAELFNILDNGGAGSAPAQKQVGDAPSTDNGLIGFSFIDSSGNVVLPQLNASGQLPVTTDEQGTCFYANGELAAGSLTLVDITSAVTTINLTKEYIKIGSLFSCLHASLGQIVHTDDVGVGDTESVLGEFICGPGQYTIDQELKCFTLDTTGGTGTQNLKIKGKNFRKLSSMRASISALELA
jgi:hypothetical protein